MANTAKPTAIPADVSTGTKSDAPAKERQHNYAVTDRVSLRFHRDVTVRFDIVGALMEHFNAMDGIVATRRDNETGVTVTVETDAAHAARGANVVNLPKNVREVASHDKAKAAIAAALAEGLTPEQIAAAIERGLAAK